jgi:hypothetical protein
MYFGVCVYIYILVCVNWKVCDNYKNFFLADGDGSTKLVPYIPG